MLILARIYVLYQHSRKGTSTSIFPSCRSLTFNIVLVYMISLFVGKPNYFAVNFVRRRRSFIVRVLVCTAKLAQGYNSIICRYKQLNMVAYATTSPNTSPIITPLPGCPPRSHPHRYWVFICLYVHHNASSHTFADRRRVVPLLSHLPVR